MHDNKARRLMMNDAPDKLEAVLVIGYISGKIFGPHAPTDALPAEYRNDEAQRRIRTILNMVMPDLLFLTTFGKVEWAGVATAELTRLRTYGAFHIFV
jgi:hypothetical protein